MSPKLSVLFVCLGNICRSPLAEGALRAAALSAKLDIDVDSAGTGNWHVGEQPDHRAQRTALRHGVDISTHRGRQVSQDDFRRFSHIIALDRQNLADLEKIRPINSTADLKLLMDYVPGRFGQSVADPYYGNEADFEATWQQLTIGIAALLRQISS